MGRPTAEAVPWRIFTYYLSGPWRASMDIECDWQNRELARWILGLSELDFGVVHQGRRRTSGRQRVFQLFDERNGWFSARRRFKSIKYSPSAPNGEKSKTKTEFWHILHGSKGLNNSNPALPGAYECQIEPTKNDRLQQSSSWLNRRISHIVGILQILYASQDSSTHTKRMESCSDRPKYRMHYRRL